MKTIRFAIAGLMIVVFLGFHAWGQVANLALLEAIEKGDKSQVKDLLEKGADVNAKNQEGKTALIMAIEIGDLGIVRVLLDKGADVNLKDHEGRTALMVASLSNDFDLVKALLAKGADPNARNSVGRTPLILAAQNGHLSIVKALIDKGADVNARSSTGATPLSMAIRTGYVDITKVLLDKGANSNDRDNDGRTPLMFAAQEGNLSIAKVLLDKGAEVNAKDLDQFTPLSYAKGSYDTQMINFLKEHGAQEAPRRLTKLGKGRGGAGMEQTPSPPPSAEAPQQQRKQQQQQQRAQQQQHKQEMQELEEQLRKEAEQRPARAAEQWPPRAAKQMAGDLAVKKIEIPLFPWPPPKPSAFARIPRELLVKRKGQTKVGDVADLLDRAFQQAGYGEKTWYAVPGGFALASRLEQFNPDGTPKDEPDRWSAKIKAPAIFGLKDMIRALFTAQEGHYRIIVFTVTPQAFSAIGKAVSPEEAREWVQKGAFNLPEAIREVDYTPEHFCEALIYEFEQSTRDNPAVFKAPSELQGETHLRKAKIWSALGG